MTDPVVKGQWPERVAIVGSRSYEDELKRERESPLWLRIVEAIAELPADTIVVSGGARGVDRMAATAARALGLKVEVIPVKPEEWKKFGRAAGPIRNGKIARACDRMIAFYDGESSGTANAIEQTRALGKPVDVRR